MKTKYLLLGFSLLILFFGIVNAVSPNLITIQGRLTDNNGDPVSGSQTFIFRIYQGSTKLWEETQTINVQNGIFNANLGSVTPLELPFNQQYDLEINVNGNTLAPRVKITKSGATIGAGNFSASGYGNFSDDLNATRIFENNTRFPQTKTCSLGQVFTAFDSSGQFTCSSGGGFDVSQDYGRSGVSNDLFEGTVKLTDKYVKRSGDTMTGSLTINQGLTVRGTLTTKYPTPVETFTISRTDTINGRGRLTISFDSTKIKSYSWNNIICRVHLVGGDRYQAVRIYLALQPSGSPISWNENTQWIADWGDGTLPPITAISVNGFVGASGTGFIQIWNFDANQQTFLTECWGSALPTP